MHFQFREFQGQGKPFLGKCFEFLIGGKLLAHFRDKLRTNELGRALAAVAVTQLVERSVLLRANRIDALASRFLASGVLLG